MNINDLQVTQDSLRDLEDLEAMVEFVKSGGVYSQRTIDKHNNCDNSNLIAINRFEDGQLFLHDGHHRVASVFLSGVRDFLYPQEYFITDFKYCKYITPNFSNGWYTPFDPRTHVRVADFFDLKKEVKAIAKKSEKQAVLFIKDNQSKYLLPRTKKHKHISGILETSNSQPLTKNGGLVVEV